MPRARTSAERKRELARDRKRRQRQRQREENKRRPLLLDVAHPHIRGSFAEFLGDRSLMLFETLDWAGIKIVGDPATEDHADIYPDREGWEELFEVPLNSLNRTTVMIGALLDAARELADLVNEFKLAELDHRVAEATARSATEREIEALHQIKKRYRRSVQPRLPVYWVQERL